MRITNQIRLIISLTLFIFCTSSHASEANPLSAFSGDYKVVSKVLEVSSVKNSCPPLDRIDTVSFSKEYVPNIVAIHFLENGKSIARHDTFTGEQINEDKNLKRSTYKVGNKINSNLEKRTFNSILKVNIVVSNTSDSELTFDVTYFYKKSFRKPDICKYSAVLKKYRPSTL